MTLAPAQEEALIALVRRIGQDEVVPRFRRLGAGQIGTKTGPDDLVTQADLAAEARFRAEIDAILPGAAIIGEEAGDDAATMARAVAQDMCVVIDPIDGTWNYANGLAVFGMIVAVIRRGVTVFGLLYDPLLDDWVVARKGGGAWFARPDAAPERLQTSSTATVGETAGFVPLFLFPQERQPQVAAAMVGMGRATTLRCSCHEYRLLVQGKVDAIVNAKLKVWDHAAGILCLTEAGGAVALIDGAPYDPALSDGFLVAAGSDAALHGLRRHFAEALA